MEQSVAARVVEEAVVDPRGLAEITSSPTLEQRQALDDLVAVTEFAPDTVCHQLDLEPGRMWMEIVAAIRVDSEDVS
jgi:hypothetical protein